MNTSELSMARNIRELHNGKFERAIIYRQTRRSKVDRDLMPVAGGKA
jgi:hypothetical protein